MKPAALSLFVLPLLASATATAADEICVQNADNRARLFVAEARGGERLVSTLVPGDVLCAVGPDGQGGVVSVFESVEETEGCSRLVAAPGGTRVLHRYVSFDRCAWDDNTS